MTTKQTSTLKQATASPGGQAKAEVQAFLDRLSRALTSGDGAAAAALWAVPALVLGDTQAVAVDTLSEVARFFGGARDQYHAKGVTGTRAEIVELDWLTPRIAIVRVRWPQLNARGKEVGEETSTYTLRRDESGGLKLQVAIMHGASTESEAA